MKHPKYLAYIRDQDCCVSQTPAHGWSPIVAHHVILNCKTRGLSQKVSDYQTLPMRADIHSLLHEVGPSVFWSARDLNPYQLVTETLIKYLEEE